MSQPTPYNRGFSFTDFAAANPSQSLPGVKVDVELDAIERTLDQSLTNLAKLQRDDGALANASVGVQQLAATTLALIGSDTFSVRGAWLTSTAYLRGDFYANANQVYLVMADHTSTSIAADIASNKVVGPVFFPDTAQVAALVTALAQTTGAATIGTSGGSTVQAELTGITAFLNSLLVSTASSGAAIIGAFDFQAGAKWTTVQGYITAMLSQLGSSFVGFLQSGTGAIGRTVMDKLSDTINAKDFGAVGDAVTANEHTAINKALATGKSVRLNPGIYVLGDAIPPTTPGQVLQGSGRNATILRVPASFNLSATGVLHSNGGEPGIDVRDLWVQFMQPDVAVLGSLIAYPPAVYAQATPRLRIRRCRITGARTAIDMRGNSGGVLIEDLEVSSFDYAVRIDGALDSVRIEDLHHWPFGLTANQQTVFYASSNIGVESGRCDDLKITGCLFIGGGKQIKLINSGGGTTFGTISDTQFDTWGSVDMADGNVSMNNCSWSAGDASVRPVLHTGGNLRIANSNFECAVALTNPMIDSSMSSGAASYLSVIGSIFRVSGDTKAIRVAASSGQANATVNSNQFLLPANSSPANAVVDIAAGGRVTFQGNRASDKGTGSGNLLAIAQDNLHKIDNNVFLGWGMSAPAAWASMAASGNLSIAQGDYINGNLAGVKKERALTGTASAGGVVGIAHGITAAHLKVRSASVFYKGASGEAIPCAVTIDGTNAIVTGAGASAKVRVCIEYTETQDVW